MKLIFRLYYLTLKLLYRIGLLCLVLFQAEGQNLCNSSEAIPNGFDLLTPSVGCGPMTVEVKTKAGLTDVKYIYNYSGQSKDQLLKLGPLTNTSYTYFKENETKKYTILQYGKTEEGKNFYSCKSITVNPGIKPKYTFTICSRGVEVVIPKTNENESFDSFSIEVQNKGYKALISKDELPKTLNIDINFPDNLIITGENVNGSANCNKSIEHLKKLDATNYPNGYDLPYDVNIDTLELVEKDRVRLVFRGSLNPKGYVLQMRESTGEYPFSAFNEHAVPGVLEVDIPDTTKSYCFKLGRIASCGSYEYSAEVCTLPITKASIDESGKIFLQWSDHPKPSINQSLIQAKSIEVSKVNSEFIVHPLKSGINEYNDQLTCLNRKVCYRILNKVSGILDDYKYESEIFSNEVCLSSNELKSPAIKGAYVDIDESNSPSVLFDEPFEWPDPVKNFKLYLDQNDTLKLIDSLSSFNPFLNIPFNVQDSSYCFKIIYEDSCGIISEPTPSICTLHLSSINKSELIWSEKSPFADEQPVSYELFAQDEKNNSFYHVKQLSNSNNIYAPYLDSFEKKGTFRVKAISESGKSSFSNLEILPLAFELYIPDAFSPNGDGLNDFLEIFGTKERIKEFHFQVFDRIGNILFETNDPYFEWKGVQNFSHSGNFNFLLRALTIENEEYFNQGNLYIFY